MHNEALQTLDLLVFAAIEEEPRTDPPTVPLVGQCYIVGASATGEWAGKDQCIAGYTSGGWRCIRAEEGMFAYVKSTSTWVCYRNGSWEMGKVRGSSVVLGGVQVVGDRAAAIADPTGGATVDAESRATIGQILTALRQHGLIDT